mgnify:CR=1 FL=1
MADLSEQVTDFVAFAYASAVQHADTKIERQRSELDARERAADAEVQEAYKLVEDADAQQADARHRISELEADLRAEREARLASEKRAAESASVVQELRAQLSASKTENDDLRSSLGELRAFKERVQKHAQNKTRSPDGSDANAKKKIGKPETQRHT